MRLLRLALLPALLAVAPTLLADTAPKPPAPDSDLLEFMADWQGNDGQWVDPMTFARIDPAKVEPKTRPPERTTAPAPSTAPADSNGRKAAR